MINRGEVWLARLHPQRGTEPGKNRPVLIIQAQALLEAGHPSTVVIPLTTNLIEAAEPLRVRVQASGALQRDSDLLIDQIRAIDNTRLMRGPLTRLDAVVLSKVCDAIREILDLPGRDEPWQTSV